MAEQREIDNKGWDIGRSNRDYRREAREVSLHLVPCFRAPLVPFLLTVEMEVWRDVSVLGSVWWDDAEVV